MFAVPSNDAPGMCDHYDLSKLASLGPQTFKVGDYTYLMSLCGNVPPSSIPKQCQDLNTTWGPSVAYQYNTQSCQALGKLESILAVCCHFISTFQLLLN